MHPHVSSRVLLAGFFYLIGGDDGKSLAPWTAGDFPETPRDAVHCHGKSPHDGGLDVKIVKLIGKDGKIEEHHIDSHKIEHTHMKQNEGFSSKPCLITRFWDWTKKSSHLLAGRIRIPWMKSHDVQ